MKIKLFSLFTFSVVFLLSACDPNDDHKVKVAINAGPDEQLWQTVKQIAEQQYQLNVEVTSFNDYVQPNEALANKDVDVTAFASLPYLEQQEQERGYKFAILGNSFIFPIAGYSRKIQSLDQLPSGSIITLSNESTTLGRSLLLLQAQGLIKLKPGTGLLPTILDITNNPKQLKIILVDTPQLARSLDDPKVYLSIINNNFASLAGYSAVRDGLFREDKASPYLNVLVVRQGDENKALLQQLKQAFQNPIVAAKAQQLFQGNVVQAW